MKGSSETGGSQGSLEDGLDHEELKGCRPKYGTQGPEVPLPRSLTPWLTGARKGRRVLLAPAFGFDGGDLHCGRALELCGM